MFETREIPMRILVVEDDKDAATFIAKALGEAGHVVDVAGNGEDALGIASDAHEVLCRARASVDRLVAPPLVVPVVEHPRNLRRKRPEPTPHLLPYVPQGFFGLDLRGRARGTLADRQKGAVVDERPGRMMFNLGAPTAAELRPRRVHD